MGAITSRQNAGVEEVDIGVNHAYRYPPKSGNYFSSHFIMGGERFDTAQPEMYLFGENMDVNFLGSRPAPFPYPAPTASEPSKTLKALINIRKESLRFVRAPDDSSVVKEPQAPPPQEPPPASGPNPPAPTPSPSRFNIEFTFDCDVRCAITIMYFCTEEVTTSGMMYTPRDPSKNSETYHYKRGASQQFSQVCHVFDPSQYLEEELLYSFDRDVLPIVIYCVAEEGDVSSAKEVVMECSTSESMSLMRTRNRNGPRNGPRTEPWGTPLLTEPRQSHATFAVVEKHSDGYALKPLKQKLFVDGLSYLLQEIYGIENKNAENCKVSTEEDAEDNGAECVICMCDLRDTLILPCRHLCLCNCCADSLRYQANNCPICRAPFRALLQIKALQKATINCTNPQANSEGVEGVPAGYEAVSLIEALNGPSASPPSQPTAPPALDLYVQLPQSPAEAPPPPTAPPLDSLHRPLPIHPHPLRGETARCFVESVTVRPGQVEDSTTQTDHHSNTPGHTRPSSPAPQEMRMSVLLAQECDDVCGSKGDDDTGASPPPPQARRRAGRKRSREHHQTRDTVKVVNEIAQPRSLEVVDPSETRSLLDEDPLEGEGGRGAGRDPLDESPPTPPPPPPTAATPPLHHQPHQAEEETIDEEDEDSREEDMKSVIVVTGSTVTESSEVESQRDCQEVTNSPVLTPRKNQSGGMRAGGGGEISAPASPGGSVGLNLTHQSEPLSLPGTPLSNTSAVSRSSDASVSSASSTRALLSHPTDVPSSSIV